jgi:hypothetical protein
VNYLRLGILGAVVLAFIGLGIYAWDADRALAKCQKAAIESALAAEVKVRELKEQDAAKTRELVEKFDAQATTLRVEAQSREDAIRSAKTTVCETPDLDAYLDGVRKRSATSSSSAKSGPTGKSK